MGTKNYISPEVIRNEEATFASDLWALGIIIYLLFTGKTPFDGTTEFQTFENILSGKYTIPDYVPNEAKELIEKLLVLDP